MNIGSEQHRLQWIDIRECIHNLLLDEEDRGAFSVVDDYMPSSAVYVMALKTGAYSTQLALRCQQMLRDEQATIGVVFVLFDETSGRESKIEVTCNGIVDLT